MKSDKQFLIDRALGPKRVAEIKKETAYNTKAKSKAIEKKKGESWESAKNKYHEAHLSETKRHKRLDGTEVKY